MPGRITTTTGAYNPTNGGYSPGNDSRFGRNPVASVPFDSRGKRPFTSEPPHPSLSVLPEDIPQVELSPDTVFGYSAQSRNPQKLFDAAEITSEAKKRLVNSMTTNLIQGGSGRRVAMNFTDCPDLLPIHDPFNINAQRESGTYDGNYSAADALNDGSLSSEEWMQLHSLEQDN